MPGGKSASAGLEDCLSPALTVGLQHWMQACLQTTLALPVLEGWLHASCGVTASRPETRRGQRQALRQRPLLTANASTSSESRGSPLAARALSAVVSSRSCSSVSCCIDGSRALISSTRDWYCLRVRSAGSFLNTLVSPPSSACTGWAPRRAARRAAPPLLLPLLRRCGAAKGVGRHAADTVAEAVRPVQRCSAAAGAAWQVAADMCGSVLERPHLKQSLA